MIPFRLLAFCLLGVVVMLATGCAGKTGTAKPQGLNDARAVAEQPSTPAPTPSAPPETPSDQTPKQSPITSYEIFPKARLAYPSSVCRPTSSSLTYLSRVRTSSSVKD